MAAPRSDHGTATHHWFSKKGWSQVLVNTFKVCDICHVIEISKSNPWPTAYQTLLYDIPFDARKTDLKVFVGVIANEGLPGWGPANHLFGYDTDYRI